MSNKPKAAVSHNDREVAELRADRELAVEYLKAAMESLDDPDASMNGLKSTLEDVIGVDLGVAP